MCLSHKSNKLHSIDPDSPTNCSLDKPIIITASSIIITIHWNEPTVKKGAILLYNIDAHCKNRRWTTQSIVLPSERVYTSNQLSERYRHALYGLPSFSDCSVSIVAETIIGHGPPISCAFQSPLTSEQHISLNPIFIFP